MTHTLPAWLAFFAGSETPAVETRAASRARTAEPDPGYVYLSASRGMPGFVQVDTSVDDPRDLTWSLQTMSGVTRFRNVYAVRTSDRGALLERFRKAVLFDQIPHHSDLFKIRLRFAKNILEVESRAFPSNDPMPVRDHRAANVITTTLALAIALPLAIFGFHPSATKQAALPQAVACQVAAPQPAAAPVEVEVAQPVIKPQFRFSKM